MRHRVRVGLRRISSMILWPRHARGSWLAK
jgi:hypothetical protein